MKCFNEERHKHYSFCFFLFFFLLKWFFFNDENMLKHWILIIPGILGRSVKANRRGVLHAVYSIIYSDVTSLFMSSDQSCSNYSQTHTLSWTWVLLWYHFSSLHFSTRMFLVPFSCYQLLLTPTEMQLLRGIGREFFLHALCFQRCKSRVECAWVRTLACNHVESTFFPFFSGENNPLPTSASPSFTLE